MTKKGWKWIGCAFALILGLSFSAPARVEAAPGDGITANFSDKTYYEITSALDENFCMDIAGAATRNGANLQLYRRNSTNAQRFLLVPAGGGYYMLLNAHSGKVVDIAGNNKGNGANAQQYERNNTAAQKFKIVPNEDGISVRLQGAASGKYLTVGGGKAKNSANICLYQEIEPKADAKTQTSPGADEKKDETADEDADGMGDDADGSGGPDEGEGPDGDLSGNPDADVAADPADDAGDANGDANGGGPAPVVGVPGADEKQDGAPVQPQTTDEAEGDEGEDTTPAITLEQSWIIKETSAKLPAPGLYEVVSALNQNYCLDISGSSLKNGANAQIYSRNGTAAQKFYLRYVGGDRATLTAASSGKVLDVAGNGKKDGTNVQQYSANGTAAQTFRVVPSNAGGFELVGLASDKALDVKYAKAVNGSNVWIYSRNQSAAQRWVFKQTSYKFPSVAKGTAVPSVAGNRYLTIVAKGNSGLSVQPEKESSGSAIRLNGLNNSTKDKWIARELGGGKYEFVNVATGLALDDRGGSRDNSNPMQLYKVNNTASQSWSVVDTGDGDGSYYLINSISGKYLDIRSGNLKAGAVVQQFTGNKTIAQKFYLCAGAGIGNGWHSINGSQLLFNGGKAIAKRRSTSVGYVYEPMSGGNGKIIAIDPGHSYRIPSGSEPIGPGAGSYKEKDTYGTSGAATRKPECELTMPISVQLKDELLKRGYSVILTHESNEVAISCIERTRVANTVKASAYIRIHANGGAPSSRGAVSVSITSSNPWKRHLYSKCQKLSQCLINEYCKVTGLRSEGIWNTDTMTGNNWSDVPCTLFELGYMSNYAEDLWMDNAANQKKMVQGLANGIDAFFR